MRAQTLGRHRDVPALAGDVMHMRRRMRAELDRSDAARFDLKQGAGGLVDLEFLVQFGVLAQASAHAGLLQPRDTPALLDALAACGWLAPDIARSLHAAHAVLLDVGLACTLDRRPRLAAPTEAIAQARAAVDEALRACGLDFEPAAGSDA